jgi:hypothetical protein
MTTKPKPTRAQWAARFEADLLHRAELQDLIARKPRVGALIQVTRLMDAERALAARLRQRKPK